MATYINLITHMNLFANTFKRNYIIWIFQPKTEKSFLQNNFFKCKNNSIWELRGNWVTSIFGFQNFNCCKNETILKFCEINFWIIKLNQDTVFKGHCLRNIIKPLCLNISFQKKIIAEVGLYESSLSYNLFCL